MRASDAALRSTRSWHRTLMPGLDIPEVAELGIDPERLVGEFRGPPALPGVENRIGAHHGAPSTLVARECAVFIERLQALVEVLDALWPVAQ